MLSKMKAYKRGAICFSKSTFFLLFFCVCATGSFAEGQEESFASFPQSQESADRVIEQFKDPGSEYGVDDFMVSASYADYGMFGDVVVTPYVLSALH